MTVKFSKLREKYSVEKEALERIDESKRQRDPPPVLVLRRTGIRNFPTGEKVALYYSPKLKMTFSVPYETEKTTPTAVSEEEIAEFFNEENVIEDNVIQESQRQILRRLQNIVANNKIQEIVFENDGKRKVDVTSARAVLELHANLNSANQKKLYNMIARTPEEFSKAVAFAFKNIK